MIPSEFTILAHKVTVTIDNEYCHSKGILGLFNGDDCAITLATKRKNKAGRWIGLPPDIVLHTYYHEVVHCIFHFMGEQKMNEDEKLVDMLAGLLHQIETTKKYETNTSNREARSDDSSRDLSDRSIPADSSKTKTKRKN